MDNIRSILKRYPIDNSKIYIDPSACNCAPGFLYDINTTFTEVKTPQEADYIPVWYDYLNGFSDYIHNNYISKYPKKCCSIINLLNIINNELEEIDKDTLENILKLLKSPDSENIILGLSMLRQFKLSDSIRNIILGIVDTYQGGNSPSIIPYPSNMSELADSNKRRVSINNTDIIKYYYIWLHNKFI